MEMSGFEVYIKNRPKLVKGPKFLIIMFETSGFLYSLSLLLFFLSKVSQSKGIYSYFIYSIIHRCAYPCILFSEQPVSEI